MNPTSDPHSGRLELLVRLTQTFNSTLDLDEVLNRVMDEVIAVMRAERGFVMLRDDSGQLDFRVARGLDQRTIDDPEFEISRSTVERVAVEGQPILTSDAQTDSRFASRQSVMILGLRSVLCVPLKVKDRVTGVIYVDNRLRAGIFRPEDLELLSAIASSAAIAIENARLYRVAVEKGRMEQELQTARKMQSSLLPQSLPVIAGWEFAARWLPAREVAGDYYDFIPLPGGQLGMLIADVTDKGMPAALFMAFSRSIVRASVDAASTPAEGLTRANRLVCADSTNGYFVTLAYALLQPGNGTLTYVNAGHNPPLCYRSHRASIEKMTRSGIPLGIEADSVYSQRQITLEDGDFVLFYTDGIPDAVNAAGQPFGMERLDAVLHASRSLPAGEILNAIENAIQQFIGREPLFDDITVVVARKTLA